MELAITAIAIIAGMAFSLAVALLVEELIFGKVFRPDLCPSGGRGQIRARALRR